MTLQYGLRMTQGTCVHMQDAVVVVIECFGGLATVLREKVEGTIEIFSKVSSMLHEDQNLQI